MTTAEERLNTLFSASPDVKTEYTKVHEIELLKDIRNLLQQLVNK